MVHCHQGGGTADDLVRSLMLSGSSPTGHEERRMESLLDAIFAPSQSAGKYVDPLNRIFEEMMSFSLLAFNEASFSSSSSSLASTVAWSSEGGGGNPEQGGRRRRHCPSPDRGGKRPRCCARNAGQTVHQQVRFSGGRGRLVANVP